MLWFKSSVTCKISKIHNFLAFKSKSKSIRDYPVKKFWKWDDFWLSSMLLKKKQLKVGYSAERLVSARFFINQTFPRVSSTYFVRRNCGEFWYLKAFLQKRVVVILFSLYEFVKYFLINQIFIDSKASVKIWKWIISNLVEDLCLVESSKNK